jgi:hypothetical protein
LVKVIGLIIPSKKILVVMVEVVVIIIIKCFFMYDISILMTWVIDLKSWYGSTFFFYIYFIFRFYYSTLIFLNKKSFMFFFKNLFSIRLFRSHDLDHEFYRLIRVDSFLSTQLTYVACYLRLIQCWFICHFFPITYSLRFLFLFY